MNQVKYKLVQKPVKMTIWDRAIFAIIRPPKVEYTKKTFETNFNRHKQIFLKQSKTIPHQSEAIVVNIFRPHNQEKQNLNLIIFCHCNASNSMQCMQYLDKLPFGFAIAGFDFLGCGNTKDYYITLGYRQSKQIQSVCKSFEGQYKNIILWGRSMGAVSVLKYGKGIINVCDSPFSSLKRLTQQSAYKIPKIPNCLICCIFPCIYCKLRGDIYTKADFDIDELNIVESIKKMNNHQSIIFIISRQDKLISSQHSKELFDVFKGNKKIFEVEGDHNTPRTKQLINNIFEQINRYLNMIKSESTPKTIDSIRF